MSILPKVCRVRRPARAVNLFSPSLQTLESKVLSNCEILNADFSINESQTIDFKWQWFLAICQPERFSSILTNSPARLRASHWKLLDCAQFGGESEGMRFSLWRWRPLTCHGSAKPSRWVPFGKRCSERVRTRSAFALQLWTYFNKDQQPKTFLSAAKPWPTFCSSPSINASSFKWSFSTRLAD